MTKMKMVGRATFSAVLNFRYHGYICIDRGYIISIFYSIHLQTV